MIEILTFLSSRRRHTRYWRDWSSDVCSSDLPRIAGVSSPACRLPDGTARSARSSMPPSPDCRPRPATRDRKSAVQGKSVVLGGRRIIIKKFSIPLLYYSALELTSALFYHLIR